MHQMVAKADDLVRNQTAHILNPDKPFNLQMPEEVTLFVANLFPALIQRQISRLNAQLTLMKVSCVSLFRSSLKRGAASSTSWRIFCDR